VSGGAAAPGSADPGPASELGLWEAVDAYQRIIETATVAELAGSGDAAFHLRQAALEAVIERRMAVRAVISMHQALLAGVPVARIVQATGLSAGQVAARWAAWAGGQVRLGERAGLGMSRRECQRAAAAITAGGTALPGGAVVAGLPAVPDMHK